MGFRKTLILVLVCSTLFGCRRDPYVDVYFDMLNTEKRLLEDRLFEAEYNYERALRELQACRTKSAPSRARETRDEDDRRAPPIEAPDLPEIELPPGFSSSDVRWSDRRARPVGTGVAPRFSDQFSDPSDQGEIVRSGRDRADPAPPAGTRPPADQRVVAIDLNARRTGGIELDGMPGDDGISVLIEPRNAAGQFVAKSAAISIVLLDPLQRDEQARFARWDFDLSAAQRMMQTQGSDRGLHVQVPWTDAPPTTDRLHLFVRYSTEDGRVLESDREIVLRLPGLVADRWTPRADSSAPRLADQSPAESTHQSREIDSQVIPATHESPIREIPPR